MKKYPIWLAYSLIGIGLFLLFNTHIPFLNHFETWPAILIIIGFTFLLDSFLTNQPQHLLIGTLLLGLGIHLHMITKVDSWPDHWSVYLLIFGIAIIVRSFKIKKGLMLGLCISILSSVIILTFILPIQLNWIDPFIHQLENLWPFILMITGIYLLTKKR